VSEQVTSVRDPCPLCASPTFAEIAAVEAAAIRLTYRRLYRLDVDQFVSAGAVYRLLQCSACALQFWSPANPGGPDFYALLQTIPWYYIEDKPEYDQALEHVRPGDRILEIGAGSGAFAGRLEKTARYVGLESNPEGIVAAARRGVTLRAEEIGEHARRSESQYDFVCAFQVLEHVADPRPFIAGCVRALRPGGRLCFTVPNRDGYVGESINEILNMPPHHATRWNSAAMASIGTLFPLRLRTIECESLAHYHYPAWCAQRVFALLGMSSRSGTRLDPRPHVRALSFAGMAWGWFLSRLPTRPGLKPPGHTLLALFEKTA
jgi:2-polyprenyl-3-methyl-5-hydroxy-6-metoxy-1,4-benzoquinol methylase